jgi:predicted membrane protein
MDREYFKTLATIVLLCFSFFFLSSCLSTGQHTEEAYTVELQEAKKVSTTIAMYNGDLEILGNSQGPLLASEFSYNLKELIPEISYLVQNGEGKLKIIQKENKKGLFNPVENKWSLIFNQAVPIELDIAMGNGDNHLDLSSINLTGFKAAIGTGDTILDLTGNYQENIEIYLLGGVGHTTINLPEDIGVRLWIKNGLNIINCDGLDQMGNFYYNSTFDFSERKIFITLISGLGMIEVNLI